MVTQDDLAAGLQVQQAAADRHRAAASQHARWWCCDRSRQCPVCQNQLAAAQIVGAGAALVADIEAAVIRHRAAALVERAGAAEVADLQRACTVLPTVSEPLLMLAVAVLPPPSPTAR